MNPLNFTARWYNEGFHYISWHYGLRWFTDEDLIYVEKTSIKHVSVYIYFRFYFDCSCKCVLLKCFPLLILKYVKNNNIKFQTIICTCRNYSTPKSFLSIITCDVTRECNAKYFRCHLTPAIECHWGECSGFYCLTCTLIACLNKCHRLISGV